MMHLKLIFVEVGIFYTFPGDVRRNCQSPLHDVSRIAGSWIIHCSCLMATVLITMQVSMVPIADNSKTEKQNCTKRYHVVLFETGCATQRHCRTARCQTTRLVGAPWEEDGIPSTLRLVSCRLPSLLECFPNPYLNKGMVTTVAFSVICPI
jgi:hypothetical protein